MNFFSLKITSYDAKCRWLKLRRQLKNLRSPSTDFAFLFILCPAYCGSTLLHEILSSAPAVSPNNIYGTREGQSLPEFRKIVDHTRRWDEDYLYPWKQIRQIWLQYWDHSKALLLDKSPANLIRSQAIAEHFQPAYFVAMSRNPYVHCEGMMRRDQMTAEQAAQRALQCLRHLYQGRQQLQSLLWIRYEDLVEDPENIQKKLLQFLPSLAGLSVDRTFNSHNYTGKKLKITNFNQGKLERIHPNDLAIINRFFSKESDLLKFFNYDLHQG